ncbi:MAG: hypothetical protein KIS74_13355 [Burkholderiales bacterium]|nr:hypothetical protein [Burkholderiales bacterium]
MDDPKSRFKEAMASLIEGKRGLGREPADARSRFVGACLLTFEQMLSEAIRAKVVDSYVDVLAWELAVLGTGAGPAGIADVVARLEWHLGRLTGMDPEEAAQERDEGTEPRRH